MALADRDEAAFERFRGAHLDEIELSDAVDRLRRGAHEEARADREAQPSEHAGVDAGRRLEVDAHLEGPAARIGCRQDFGDRPVDRRRARRQHDRELLSDGKTRDQPLAHLRREAQRLGVVHDEERAAGPGEVARLDEPFDDDAGDRRDDLGVAERNLGLGDGGGGAPLLGLRGVDGGGRGGHLGVRRLGVGVGGLELLCRRGLVLDERLDPREVRVGEDLVGVGLRARLDGARVRRGGGADGGARLVESGDDFAVVEARELLADGDRRPRAERDRDDVGVSLRRDRRAAARLDRAGRLLEERQLDALGARERGGRVRLRRQRTAARLDARTVDHADRTQDDDERRDADERPDDPPDPAATVRISGHRWVSDRRGGAPGIRERAPSAHWRDRRRGAPGCDWCAPARAPPPLRGNG
jgi:hypothetical protein